MCIRDRSRADAADGQRRQARDVHSEKVPDAPEGAGGGGVPEAGAGEGAREQVRGGVSTIGAGSFVRVRVALDEDVRVRDSWILTS